MIHAAHGDLEGRRGGTGLRLRREDKHTVDPMAVEVHDLESETGPLDRLSNLGKMAEPGEDEAREGVDVFRVVGQHREIEHVPQFVQADHAVKQP